MAYLVGDFGNNILPPSGTVIDGEPENFLFGDTDGTLFPPNAGGNDTLTGGAFSSFNFLFGDADVIKNGAAGGDDFLTGGVNATSNELYGDADLMKNGAVGGDDSLTGGADSFGNLLYGDAKTMRNRSEGGDDTLTGGASSDFNDLYGDAQVMNSSSGGSDDLTGSSNANANGLHGDAYEMISSRGGDDSLTGGDASLTNALWGDASIMRKGSRGAMIPSQVGRILNETTSTAMPRPRVAAPRAETTVSSAARMLKIICGATSGLRMARCGAATIRSSSVRATARTTSTISSKVGTPSSCGRSIMSPPSPTSTLSRSMRIRTGPWTASFVSMTATA